MENQQQLTATENSLVSKVEIRVQCRNLLNLDVTSKSDPMVVCYLLKGNTWIEVGRTENIKNTLNPDFAKPFVLNYYFEEVQKLTFDVYDLDNQTIQLSDDDFLGRVETTLSLVVAQKPFTKPLVMRNGSKAGNGSITLLAEEVGVSRDNLHLSFSARKLDNKDFFSKSDPFLEIRRVTPEGAGVLIYRTEVIKNNLNPTWATFMLTGSSINVDNPEQQLKLSCYDHDGDGSHDFIGETYITIENLLEAQDTVIEWPCINPKKKAKKGASYVDSGKIIIRNCKIVKEYTFLDYIFGGCQLNFTVGIDFTASNGKPSDPKSLHYINRYTPNEYMQAISAVGAVIQDYDSDKMFPALGFGARIPPTNEVSHEFALNFNISNPFCPGVQGILDAYQTCLPQIQFYGPTNISPIIYHVGRFAEVAHHQSAASNYYILLIITDGVITDMDETRKAIVYVSRLPMSVIIIGVGNADFTEMRLLDGDDGILRAPDGTPAIRDIVQFVPFRSFQNSAALLSKEVLAEIPSQVTGYFHIRGLIPNSPSVNA